MDRGNTKSEGSAWLEGEWPGFSRPPRLSAREGTLRGLASVTASKARFQKVPEPSSDVEKEKPAQQKPEAPSWLIEKIAEASKNTRTIYVLYLSFLAYCTLTVVSTSDRQIVLDEGASLPVIGVDVPFNIFIVAAPVLAVLFFCYLQLYLQRLKSLRQDLWENYAPAGKKRIYPWLVNIADNPEPGWVGVLQRAVVQVLLWWLLPLALTLIACLYLKKHVPLWSYVMGLSPGVGTLLVLYFWHQYEERGRPFWGSWARVAMVASMAAFEIFVLLFAIPRSLEGRRTLGVGFFIDLSDEVLITERKAEYDVPWLDLEGYHLEGANLDGAVLKNARIRWLIFRGLAFAMRS